MTIPISGEERERKQFVAAVENGYVLVSESFILFLPSSLLFSEFIYTSDYEDRFNSLPL